MKSKKFPDNDIYLDHNENDPTTKAYFSQNKLKIKLSKMRYLDDVYGLIDGIKNGYGKAVLPLHLIRNEKDLEVLESKRSLLIPTYLQFYVQPYYKSIHALFLSEIQSFFQENLRQQK